MSGWIKLHRQITESDVYQMPPLYLRVFERLIIEANHQDNEIPYKKHSQDIACKKLIKRGERLTSIRQICQWVGWYERGIFKMPNPKTIKTILDWLQQNDMIQIYNDEGNRKETHYRIVNYEIYQSDDDIKVTEKKQSGNSKETEKKQSLDTNKNDKNDKNEKNDKKLVIDPFLREILNQLQQIKDYPFDFDKDIDFIKSLLTDFPDLNLQEEIKKWATYKLDKPFKKKSNPRSQFRNWCKKALEWRKEKPAVPDPVPQTENVRIRNTSEPPDEKTLQEWLARLPT
ncbi:MAG TPA: hypothetical protein GXX35_11365 [Thermoanaerobacterales bacterium]|nr:hypothetical protein [Thermoanaerobacterales bacterium]